MTKTKIQIKSIFGKVLFEYKKENNTLKETLIKAIKQYADLRFANLQSANLRSADLQSANLQYADLQYADLQYADLQSANLRFADLRSADLRYADLQSADLQSANLQYADLRSADLRYANLRFADLRSADLRSNKIKHLFQIIPEEGSFVAWKKGKNNYLIKLEIPKEAKRHNTLGGRKCRAEFVKVLDIRNSKGYKVKECHNGTNSNKILYRIGETVYPDSYDPDPLAECSNGIHFFVTKQEAKDW